MFENQPVRLCCYRSPVAPLDTFVVLRPGPKADPTKFEYAVNRSADAGRIITLLAVTPDEGLPKEIAQRAEAIGVFPKVVKESQMFSQHWKGYGVISTRTEKGWTLPAFYQFSGNGFGNPFSNSESYAVILCS